MTEIKRRFVKLKRRFRKLNRRFIFVEQPLVKKYSLIHENDKQKNIS